MAWPPASSINSTGLGYEGSLPTTLAWGTDGLYPGVIVTSVRDSQMIEEIKIDNGSGITATQIILKDGEQYEITVIDDRSITWPSSGTTVTLYSPLFTGGSATSVTFIVVDNAYAAARKAAGERTLLCKKYTLITPVNMS